MDRAAQVRAARRRRALDALAFERDRAAMLAEQLEERVAEVDGPRLDAAIYAQLSPDEIQLVRAAFRDYEVAVDLDPEPSLDHDHDASSGDADTFDRGREDEEEIARLQDELASSGRLQAALERYLDLLQPVRLAE